MIELRALPVIFKKCMGISTEKELQNDIESGKLDIEVIHNPECITNLFHRVIQLSYDMEPKMISVIRD